MSEGGDISMTQIAEWVGIVGNTAAIYYLYNKINSLQSANEELSEQLKAQSVVNSRLTTSIGQLESRMASIEGRIMLLEQRPINHQQVTPQYLSYDMSQTDPRGYNPYHQPNRYPMPDGIPKPISQEPVHQQRQQPNIQQQYQSYTPPNHSNNPTAQHRSSSSSESRRSERLSRDQIIADAQSGTR